MKKALFLFILLVGMMPTSAGAQGLSGLAPSSSLIQLLQSQPSSVPSLSSEPEAIQPPVILQEADEAQNDFEVDAVWSTSPDGERELIVLSEPTILPFFFPVADGDVSHLMFFDGGEVQDTAIELASVIEAPKPIVALETQWADVPVLPDAREVEVQDQQSSSAVDENLFSPENDPELMPVHHDVDSDIPPRHDMKWSLEEEPIPNNMNNMHNMSNMGAILDDERVYAFIALATLGLLPVFVWRWAIYFGEVRSWWRHKPKLNNDPYGRRVLTPEEWAKWQPRHRIKTNNEK